MTQMQNEKKYGDDSEEYARRDRFSDCGRWRRALLSCAVRSVVLVDFYCYDQILHSVVLSSHTSSTYV